VLFETDPNSPQFNQSAFEEIMHVVQHALTSQATMAVNRLKVVPKLWFGAPTLEALASISVVWSIGELIDATFPADTLRLDVLLTLMAPADEVTEWSCPAGSPPSRRPIMRASLRVRAEIGRSFDHKVVLAISARGISRKSRQSANMWR
jgi:hypothetical protein